MEFGGPMRGPERQAGQWLNVALHSDQDRKKIINKEVKATIRKGYVHLNKDDNLLLVDFNYPLWAVMVDIIDVSYCTFEIITQKDRRLAGFDSKKDMFERFNKIYHDLSPDDAATVITFNNPRHGSKDAANLSAK